jgi:hypothetical protein
MVHMVTIKFYLLKYIYKLVGVAEPLYLYYFDKIKILFIYLKSTQLYYLGFKSRLNIDIDIDIDIDITYVIKCTKFN